MELQRIEGSKRHREGDRVDGDEIELHGPPWFWQRLGIREGDGVTAKGVLVSMMEPGEGWHEALIPFELIVNGKTYGDASKGIPIWMQGA
jgi:hypothetical protein